MNVKFPPLDTLSVAFKNKLLHTYVLCVYIISYICPVVNEVILQDKGKCDRNVIKNKAQQSATRVPLYTVKSLILDAL